MSVSIVTHIYPTLTPSHHHFVTAVFCSSSFAAIRCPRLFNPANGRVSAPLRTVGSEATYSCIDGYRLEGASTRVCQGNSDWSGEEPVCVGECATTITCLQCMLAGTTQHTVYLFLSHFPVHRHIYCSSVKVLYVFVFSGRLWSTG